MNSQRNRIGYFATDRYRHHFDGSDYIYKLVIFFPKIIKLKHVGDARNYWRYILKLWFDKIVVLAAKIFIETSQLRQTSFYI